MKYLLLLCLLITVACGPSSKQTAALESLKRLDAHTRTGVDRLKYKELLGEARYAFENAFEVKDTISNLPEAGKKMWLALNCHEMADSLWEGGDLKYNDGRGIQEMWASCRKSIKEAEELMR